MIDFDSTNKMSSASSIVPVDCINDEANNNGTPRSLESKQEYEDKFCVNDTKDDTKKIIKQDSSVRYGADTDTKKDTAEKLERRSKRKRQANCEDDTVPDDSAPKRPYSVQAPPRLETSSPGVVDLPNPCPIAPLPSSTVAPPSSASIALYPSGFTAPDLSTNIAPLHSFTFAPTASNTSDPCTAVTMAPPSSAISPSTSTSSTSVNIAPPPSVSDPPPYSYHAASSSHYASSENSSGDQGNISTAVMQHILREQKEIISSIQRLEEMMMEAMAKLDYIAGAVGARDNLATGRLPSPLDRLPANTEQEFDVIEQAVQDRELRQLLVQHWGREGAHDIPDSTRRTFTRLFTNQCAEHFNWSGKSNHSGSLKRAFSSTTLCSVVIDAVKLDMAGLPGASTTTIENNIKEWFWRACARPGGSKTNKDRNSMN